MDIAIDVRSLMEGRHSGVEEYTTQLIRAMAAAAPKHKFKLFYNSWREIKLPDFSRSANVSIHPWRYPNRAFNSVQYTFDWPQWNKLVEADVFFVPNTRLLPLAPNIPFVVTAHDLSFERFPEFYSWQRRAWHTMMRPRRLLGVADHIIAVSQSTKQDLISLYDIPANRITVIHSGVEQPSHDARGKDRLRVITKYNLPRRFILFLGTIEPRKNVASIIAAFTAIKDSIDHDLVIAGVDGWLTKPVTEAIAASTARDRIRKIGFVDPADKQALMATADLFVYPSFYEGFGFPPLEALLAGTPVITAHNSSLPEIVGKWSCLVNPYDPAELALVILEQLKQPFVVSESAKREICGHYSWELAARATIAVLEAVI